MDVAAVAPGTGPRRRARSPPCSASSALTDVYHMTEAQAEAVVRLQLGQLAALERDEILKEYNDLREQIRGYEELLADEREHPRRHPHRPGRAARQVRRRPQDGDHATTAATSTWRT